MQNDFEKSWYITEIINDYYRQNYKLEIFLDSVINDILTISATEKPV
jgi:hypothetical protein